MRGMENRNRRKRVRLNHPVIDSDGHTVEFGPAVTDILKKTLL
jgi:hypothetical protein